MKPHATCPAGRADVAECAPLGRPIPSLTEASSRSTAPVNCCQGRCATTMPVPTTR
jgi:hypothetical protein